MQISVLVAKLEAVYERLDDLQQALDSIGSASTGVGAMDKQLSARRAQLLALYAKIDKLEVFMRVVKETVVEMTYAMESTERKHAARKALTAPAAKSNKFMDFIGRAMQSTATRGRDSEPLGPIVVPEVWTTENYFTPSLTAD
ncbi:hypothetical protein SARC_10083 [Sphaeroforma arctica JP610]|uniref:Uncharacterized protein n=1 Tax=Sphaeroforma arctica JP610 TaxID=667725 RepID=A0A0L0FLU7_9EUKA|nr:hypothetical protein SARC_10083 [Sphaeroforma arctica JP610]KNC77456.1 hypothetical protein SARC_10083 [Sphaeroforma arctica JP610]|eukprot:XP_014151358.1 hypothetical protein SARC_10083 [Sphaeroforma arctica JP610]